MKKDFHLRNEAGWVGAFTRDSAPGALPPGTRIVKTAGEAGDGTPEGTPGVILGSISDPSIRGGEVCYFIEWASTPRVAVAAMAFKVRQGTT